MPLRATPGSRRRLRRAGDVGHSFATSLEDAGIPARVIDEPMGHQPSGRARRPASGQRHRGPLPPHTPEMAARVVTAVEERLVWALAAAEAALDHQPW